MRMSTRLRPNLFAALLCAAAVSAYALPVNAADTPPNSDPKNFQGIWQGAPVDHYVTSGFRDSAADDAPSGQGAGGGGGGPPGPPPAVGFGAAATSLPLKPEVAEKLRKRQELNLGGSSVMGWNVACRPSSGAGGLGDDLGAANIIQTPTRILFLYESSNNYWEVYLDRDHPKNLKPSYGGHSVGHWEGNVLVVDTIGFNDRSSVIQGVSSKQAHTITRLWKEDGGKTLKYTIYIEDPANLSKPATTSGRDSVWAPDLNIYEEHCTQSFHSENFADMLFEDFTREEAFPFLVKYPSFYKGK
jgi:hypothetical protein